MQLDRFSLFFHHASTEGVVFYHSGNLDQETVAAIGALLRRRLQEEGATGVQSRKVFTTFMEMAQNVLHYAAADEAADGKCSKFGAFSVARDAQGFQVMCGNYMSSEQVPRVRAKLEAVQTMGPELVRQAYRQQLSSEEHDPESKGAGLGILTMAASSKAPIEFVFGDSTPDGKTFLFLKAII